MDIRMAKRRKQVGRKFNIHYFTIDRKSVV